MTHRTRRRADELADAIRAATLAELADHGYAGVTYEGVARRVRTSKPVLYRRYRSRGQMVLDAVVPQATDEITPIDTGSLRGDLIALLELIAARVQHVGIEAYHGIIGESGDSLADTVAELDGGASQKMRKILDADRPRPRPVTRAASSGSNVLAWDTSRWPSADMVILGQRTAFFTWKVPSARRRQVLQQVLSSQAKGAF